MWIQTFECNFSLNKEIKNQLEGFKTSDIANFTLGFIEAFKVLNNVRFLCGNFFFQSNGFSVFFYKV